MRVWNIFLHNVFEGECRLFSLCFKYQLLVISLKCYRCCASPPFFSDICLFTVLLAPLCCFRQLAFCDSSLCFVRPLQQSGFPLPFPGLLAFTCMCYSEVAENPQHYPFLFHFCMFNTTFRVDHCRDQGHALIFFFPHKSRQHLS